METYFALLRDGKTATEADDITTAYRPYLVDFSFRDVQDAMALRLQWHRRRKGISYSDAIGYFMARKLGVKFLTGDNEFRGAPGVTFIRVA